MASTIISVLFLVLVSLSLVFESGSAQLSTDYYKDTCPKVEKIVREEMKIIIKEMEGISAGLIRMHFHDCFVRGCEASVLLNSTYYNKAEKDAPPNLTLRGFEAVERVKAKLEEKQECCKPNTVSCADVLALMARDGVELIGGPTWKVELGRRDGRESYADETKDLPPPTAEFKQLTQMFDAKGLNITDLVVLSGCHTIGITHCESIRHRLYNFTGQNNVNDFDPFMDGDFRDALRTKCPIEGNAAMLIDIDSGSNKTFDTSYYANVDKLDSTFHSDWALRTNSITEDYVQRIATGTPQARDQFFNDFAKAIVKMGRIGVLTGTQGEIRNKCYMVNPAY